MGGHRQVAFTSEEKRVLLTLVCKFKDVLENKRTDTNSIQLKLKVWDRICAEFNRIFDTTQRNSQQLKKCVENMKYRCKRDEAKFEQSSFTNHESGLNVESASNHGSKLSTLSLELSQPSMSYDSSSSSSEGEGPTSVIADCALDEQENSVQSVQSPASLVLDESPTPSSSVPEVSASSSSRQPVAGEKKQLEQADVPASKKRRVTTRNGREAMNILRQELDARLSMCLEEQQRQRDENLLTRSRLKAQLDWTLERVSLERQQLEERQRHQRSEHALRTKHMEQLHALSVERLRVETEAARLNAQCKSLELQHLQSKTNN